MSNSLYNYIAVEGNIGAGKTSLVTLLGKKLGYSTLFEEFETNPFLTDFYKDIKKHAFPVEMFFLAERYKQLTNVKPDAGNEKPKLVADYFILKSLIFASFTLDSVEFGLFKRFFDVIQEKVFLPDLIVYLERDNDYLLGNIQNRGREYEAFIQPDYLSKVNEGYREFFKKEVRMPVIIINIGNKDVFEPLVLEALIAKVFTEKWPKGVQRIDL